MRAQITPEYQKLYNKVCAKQDFTYDFPGSKGRYVVSTTSIWKGNNPSMEFGLIVDIKDTLETASRQGFDSIGGWVDLDTGLYHLDLNLRLDDLKMAILLAEDNDQKCIWDSEAKVAIHLTERDKAKK